MYEDLIKMFRTCAEADTCIGCPYLGTGECDNKAEKAADAIEELQQTVEHYKGCSDDWYREACDYKAICEQMKATVIVEAQHTDMYDERDKKTLIEMAKSLPLQIVPYKDSKPRWTPVTERLPDGEVLAFNAIKGSYSYHEYLVGYVCENCESDSGYSCESEGEILMNVTHWMPLPEPPKEET